MVRLFVSDALVSNHLILLTDRDVHYVLHVMRQKVGDEILCCNGTDGEWRCRLQQKNKKEYFVIPQQQLRPQQDPPFLALCPALIKKDNFDFVLQKATELGVTDIYPLLTEYTAHPHFNAEHAALVVKEAAEQSERLTLPQIHQPLKLPQLQKKLPQNCCCYYLEERKQESNIIYPDKMAAFLVGPEGGWSPSEKEFLVQQPQYYGLHFETGILRAETASRAILSCWQLAPALNRKK